MNKTQNYFSISFRTNLSQKSIRWWVIELTIKCNLMVLLTENAMHFYWSVHITLHLMTFKSKIEKKKFHFQSQFAKILKIFCSIKIHIKSISMSIYSSQSIWFLSHKQQLHQLSRLFLNHFANILQCSTITFWNFVFIYFSLHVIACARKKKKKCASQSTTSKEK